MSTFQLKRPSTGTVLGLIAIVIAIVGTANATPSGKLVRKGDIAPGAVTAKTFAKGAVHAKALAKGAVTSKALAKGAVNKRVLAKGAVIASSISPNAVTAAAIAPGSVYGGALGEQTIHTTPMADLDAVAENGTWTASDSAVAACAPGERLLSVGFIFDNPGNREVAFLQALPFISPTNNGVNARFTSNSGGSAKGEAVAVCLK